MDAKPSVTSAAVEDFDGTDEEAERGWVHPDDRLWRHPSEMASVAAAAPAPPASVLAKMPNVVAVAGLAGMIGALFTAGLIAAIGGFNRVQERPVRSVERVAATPFVQASKTTAVVDPIVSVAQRLRPAIVEVRSEGGGGRAAGSGVAFREDGYILTNHHVIEGASSVMVVSAEGKRFDAKVVGSDPETDISVLKINAALPVATLGSVSGLQVGQQAIAIGSPLGLTGGPSVTVGVVSALGRQFDSAEGPMLLDMIQTDAPISPGSSGGALVDSAGNVIGITTAIAVSDVGAEGLGFATPIDIARDVAEQILSRGHVIHVWLGVQGEDLQPAMAKTLGVAGGALVREVVKDSPAFVAGLKAQDIITTVDGKSVQGIADVIVNVRTHKVGDEVKVVVLRGGKPQTFVVTLRERS